MPARLSAVRLQRSRIVSHSIRLCKRKCNGERPWLSSCETGSLRNVRQSLTISRSERVLTNRASLPFRCDFSAGPACTGFRCMRPLLEEAQRRGLDVLGYRLMPNHVHIAATPCTEGAPGEAIGRTHLGPMGHQPLR